MLDFKYKWWEALGLVTDTHKGWNYGFIDGFNHVFWMGLSWVLSYYFFPWVSIAGVSWSVLYFIPIVGGIFLFLEEMWQARNMRYAQVYDYWKFWKWPQGRHQDVLLAVLTVVGLNFATGVYG